ncbi:MAG: hypothetical protein ACSLE1_05275 [Sphingobium sp.]
MNDASPYLARYPAAVSTLIGLCLVVPICLGLNSIGLYGSDASFSLLGRAILAGDGQAGLSAILTSYPPVTQAALVVADAVLPAQGLEASLVLSCIMGGLLVSSWAVHLRRAGYPLAWAFFIAMLLALNPLFVRCLAEGPAALMLLWATWCLALGLLGLRAHGEVTHLMIVSLALPLLVLSSPLGAAFAFSSVPFLLFCVPRELIGRSPAGVMIILLFPMLFCLVSMLIVATIFLSSPLESLMQEAAAFQGRGENAAFQAAALALAALPLVLLSLTLTPGRLRLRSPKLALLGTTVISSGVAVLFGATESIALAIAPTASILAAVAIRWPVHKRRPFIVALLIASGFIGSAAAIWLDAPAAAAQRNTALRGGESDPAAQGAAKVGRYLRGYSDVLIDAEQHPQVVAARGDAKGLVTPRLDAFQIAVLRRRIVSRAVALPRPSETESADQISRAFPTAYEAGLPGYRLDYDAGGWRVWRRISTKGEH